jgi:hypothetical protein
MQDDVLSIEEAFGDLTDPRSRTSPYDLTQMLVVALCAILSGADSWVAIDVGGCPYVIRQAVGADFGW